jgi:multidrug efflux pump subunit AcrA (membrane-fusion protein)
MDVLKEKNKTKVNKKSLYATVLVAVLILAFIMKFLTKSTTVINLSEVIVSKVKKGNLDVIVEGYGRLVSDKKQLITAHVDATVKEIIRKPGALVLPSSVILVLENSDLLQQFKNENQQFLQLNGNLRQLKLTNKRELLSENTKLSEIEGNHKAALLKRKAESSLVEKGIVARLDFEKSILNEQQLFNSIENTKNSIKQLISIHEEAINIQLELIKRQKGNLEATRIKIEKLTVLAGLEGVLQKLPVKLGQRVSIGGELALIGSVTDLIGSIKIPQREAQKVKLGQKATIDTRQGIINGFVSRIDPIVDKNTVSIEVTLPKDLPPSARPQLNIDGIITTNTLSDVLYIERPAYIKSNSIGELFRLDRKTKSLTKVKLKFGRLAGRYIEIISGAGHFEEYVITKLAGDIDSERIIEFE